MTSSVRVPPISEPLPPPDRETVNAEYLARGLDWLRRLLRSAEPPMDERWWDDPLFCEPSNPPALEELAARLLLTRFETLTLLLSAAVELDPTFPTLYAEVVGDARTADATFALAMSLLPQPSWDALSPYGPLRRWRLVEPLLGDGPLTSAPLRVDARVVNYLKGLNEPDERLLGQVRNLDDRWGAGLVPTLAAAVDTVTACWREPTTEMPAVVQLLGPDRLVLRNVAAAAAHRTGWLCHELSVERLPTGAGELRDLVQLLDREAALLPTVLFLDTAEIPDQLRSAMSAVCERTMMSVVLAGPEPVALSGRRTRLVDATRPTLIEQQQLWQRALGPGNDLLSARLADHFDLDPTTIQDVAGQHAHPADPRVLDQADGNAVWDDCRNQARPALMGLATHVEPQTTWDDLVLAAPELTALHQLADQVRGRPTVLREWGMQEAHGRGNGVTALFVGQSGTGKTLAAEVLAHELRLSLCRVDLSGVVSKYIGETERNLRRIFDAAERGGVLLFFDEADALFGKRSEVRDSHDRYANIEVNYLLQRMETFHGVAVLATNQRQSMDAAFTRRLRMVVTFPFPAPAQRLQMWERAFSPATPVVGLDPQRLSELPVTGAMVRTIALNTACCAAGRGQPVDMPLLLEMARAEFRKLDLPLPPVTFADVGGPR